MLAHRRRQRREPSLRTALSLSLPRSRVVETVLAILALFVIVEAFGLFVVGLLVAQDRARTRHLTRVMLALRDEVRRQAGVEVAVDRSLLGEEPEDVVATEEDEVSRIPTVRPWR